MATSRHLSRVIVMQTLFSYEFHGGEPETVLGYIAKEFGDKGSDLAFSTILLKGILDKRSTIHNEIVNHAPQWPVDKIAPIDRAILELGIYEILFSTDVPPVVALDEAIELAKTFGSENSQKFINGVLNAVLNTRTAQGKAPGA